MIMIQLSTIECNNLNHMLKEHAPEPEKLKQIFQDFYDKKVQEWMDKVAENNHQLVFTDKNGQQEMGTVRKAGTRWKNVVLSEIQEPQSIRTQRIRSEELKRCDVILLSIMVPHSSLLLWDMAEIVTVEKPLSYIERHKNTYITPRIVYAAWKKWNSEWRQRIKYHLCLSVNKADDFCSAALRCMQVLHQQIMSNLTVSYLVQD